MEIAAPARFCSRSNLGLVRNRDSLKNSMTCIKYLYEEQTEHPADS